MKHGLGIVLNVIGQVIVGLGAPLYLMGVAGVTLLAACPLVHWATGVYFSPPMSWIGATLAGLDTLIDGVMVATGRRPTFSELILVGSGFIVLSYPFWRACARLGARDGKASPTGGSRK